MGSTLIAKEDVIDVILQKDDKFFNRLIHVPNALVSRGGEDGAMPTDADADDTEEEEEAMSSKLATQLEVMKKREELSRKELKDTQVKHVMLKQSMGQTGEHKMQLDHHLEKEANYEQVVKAAEERLRQMKPDAGLKFEVKEGMRELRVLAALEGRATEDAGIKRKDVEEVNGLKVTSIAEYQDAMMMARPGQAVLFVVRREHLLINVSLVVGAEGYTQHQTDATLRLVNTHRTDLHADFTKAEGK